MRNLRLVPPLLAFALGALSVPCQAQVVSTEERFQDLFVTAGYGTAFGAAFGAALLSFTAKPQENLRFIALGASVGFIGGSLLGSYVVFTPAFVSDNSGNQPFTELETDSSSDIRLVPSFSPTRQYKLAHVESQWTIARF